MKAGPSQQSRRTKRAGRAVFATLIGLGLVTTAAALIYVLTRGPARTGPIKTPVSQEAIDTQLNDLQQAFQQGLQDKQDLSRLEARVELFTRDHPGQTAGHVLLAQMRMHREAWEEAYASWLLAIGQQPREPEFHKLAGNCAAKLNRVGAALGHYQEAIRSAGDSADSDTYAAVGLLHLALERVERAEEAYRNALTAPGPGTQTNWRHKARAGLADVAAVRGDFATALREIDEAIDWADKDSEADLPGYMIQKARIYMQAGRDQDAVTMLAYTISEDPRAAWRIESARLRARLYERAGDLRRAANHIAAVTEHWYQQPERNNHELAEYVALLADWQIKAGDHEAARTSLHNLETLAPEHPQLEALRSALR